MTPRPRAGVLLLALLLLAVASGPTSAEEPSFADVSKALRRAFKRLDLERPKNLEKQLRPRLPAGIVTESAPFDALVDSLLAPQREQIEARKTALASLAAFPPARAGAAIELALRSLDKEAAELEERIQEVEEAYAEVFDRGYMESSETVRGTRKLAAVLIPAYRRLLIANGETAAAMLPALEAWAAGDGWSWVESRARSASEPRLRALCARALAAVRTPAARALLVRLRADDDAAAVRLDALASLLAWPTFEIAEEGILPALADEAWQVRALAIAASRRAKLLAATEPLIEALAAEPGRLREDIDEALYAMHGVRLYGDVARWQAWWAENREGVEARIAAQAVSGALDLPLGAPEGWPTEALEDPGTRERRGGTSSFYGIETGSRRVLFVVDISFSMDQEAASGRSKLDVAKEQLASAIEALPDDAVVDIVVYSESYAAWQGEVVALGRQRKKLSSFLAPLRANGTTNVSDALDKAFALAGDDVRRTGGELAVDTVFLLSDGDPNRGRLSRLDELLADVLARNARARFVFHTVGIGEAAGSSFLKALAARTGGRYVEFR